MDCLKKRVSSVAVLIVGLCATTVATPLSAATVADFENIVLAPNSELAGGPGAGNKTPILSGGAEFNRTYLDGFNCCPGAFAASNHADLTTAGFTNPYSAYHLPSGGGAEGSNNFAVGLNFFAGDAVVTLPEATTVQGAYFTNSTYAYLAVVDGNDGAGFVKGSFVDGDWFLLEVIGKDTGGVETGRVDVYLADYRDGKSIALDEWTWFDLTALGDEVQTLEFELSSTDTGVDGMNTPSYFAIDNLTFGAIASPEPSSAILLIVSVSFLVGRCRMQKVGRR